MFKVEGFLCLIPIIIFIFSAEETQGKNKKNEQIPTGKNSNYGNDGCKDIEPVFSEKIHSKIKIISTASK